VVAADRLGKWESFRARTICVGQNCRNIAGHFSPLGDSLVVLGARATNPIPFQPNDGVSSLRAASNYHAASAGYAVGLSVAAGRSDHSGCGDRCWGADTNVSVHWWDDTPRLDHTRYGPLWCNYAKYYSRGPITRVPEHHTSTHTAGTNRRGCKHGCAAAHMGSLCTTGQSTGTYLAPPGSGARTVSSTTTEHRR